MTKLRLETQNNGMAKIHLNKEVITDLEFCEDNVDENYDSCVKARTSLEMDGTLNLPISLSGMGLTSYLLPLKIVLFDNTSKKPTPTVA